MLECSAALTFACQFSKMTTKGGCLLFNVKALKFGPIKCRHRDVNQWGLVANADINVHVLPRRHPYLILML